MCERHAAAVLIDEAAFGKVRLVFYVENEDFINLCFGQALRFVYAAQLVVSVFQRLRAVVAVVFACR